MKGYKINQGQSSVNPIRDEDDLKNFINYFKKKRDKTLSEQKARLYDRNYIMILVGVNTALRFSDLRRLTVGKVKFNYIIQRDKKTRKENKFSLHKEIFDEVQAYIKRQGLTDDDDYLFYSRKGVNKPLSRVQGYNIIQEIKDGIKLRYQVGTHTLRKTFGYWFYKQYGDVVALQSILNHSTPAMTLIYIGMQKVEVEEKRKHFILR